MIKTFWAKLKPKQALKVINFWPPYFAAGIKVISFNEDLTKIEVQMKQSSFNTNYVGTHFGGSLYSMCDPFYMFMLIHHLGKEHIVWDHSAEIKFIKPGKGIVRAIFSVTLEEINQYRQMAFDTFKIYPKFETFVYDSQDQQIAQVKKVLYVRRKDAKERFLKTT
jgi:acyl-coenzyme A thioesterase PaaI-like protein